MSHRDSKLDNMLGKRVMVELSDGSKYTGVITFCDKWYELHNVINHKTGFIWHDVIFRKSNVKHIEVVK